MFLPPFSSTTMMTDMYIVHTYMTDVFVYTCKISDDVNNTRKMASQMHVTPQIAVHDVPQMM